MVIVFGEVAQHEGGDGGIEVIADELGNDVVRKVAAAAHHALFHAPGVGAHFEHVEIVIRFEQQAVGATQMEMNGFRHVAEVGGDADFHALGADGEAHGVDGVVGDGEALDVDIADGEGGARLEGFELGGVAVPIDGLGGEVRDVNGNVQLAGDADEPCDVIGMLMRDEDGLERFRVFFDIGEAAEGLAAAEPGINEDTGLAGRDEGGIAGTAAG